MALLDLWVNSPDQVRDKHVQQLIVFAGDGKLLDGGSGPQEFRAFLSNVPTAFLKRYAGECLTGTFQDSGLALQDIVNEVGSRLDAKTTPGRYRGVAGQIAHDGLWQFADGHAIVVEVKTTDTYRIDLERIASYRKSLTEAGAIAEEKSSILIVIGRQDTGDLEAQIRGSRHAWDVRIISVDALLRLLEIKEEVEDPQIIRRIHHVLVPREFTRLDEIVDILFSTAEDIKDEVLVPGVELADTRARAPKFTPVAFHDACIERIEKHLSCSLLKRTRGKFSTPDGKVAVNCTVSKEHDPGDEPNYWFAFHPHQKEFLESAEQAYVALGCGTQAQLLLIPFSAFKDWLPGLWTTESEERFYWHVVVYREGEAFVLHRKKGESRVDLSRYLLTST